MFYLFELRDFNLKEFSECLDLDSDGLIVTSFKNIFDMFMNVMYNTVKKDESIMYMCTEVTSMHLCSLGSKCLVTFKRVLFSLSLGIPSLGRDLPSSVVNEKIFKVKICDRPGTLGCYSWVLYRSFIGQKKAADDRYR